MSGLSEQEREELASALTCSQCGLTFGQRDCGSTHAIIAADPTRHRLIEAATAARLARVEAEREEALGRLARVARLADEWDEVVVADEWDAAERWSNAADELRAALAGDGDAGGAAEGRDA